MTAVAHSVSAPREGGTTPPDAAPAGTRDRLVAAAIEVFRRDGYERARVQDIARTAGLTTGAIYANFRDKADLLLAAITRCSTREMVELLGGAGDAEPRAVIAELGARLVAPRPDRPLLVEAIAAASRDPQLAEVLQRVLADRLGRFGALLDEAVAAGDLDPTVDRDALVHLCATLALGSLVARALELPAPDPGAWAALLDRLLDALAPAAPAPPPAGALGQRPHPSPSPGRRGPAPTPSDRPQARSRR